jgi:hypothetical protein
LQLDDPREAFIELAKGKYTSDPVSHSGEGVYFTSRMFDKFRIQSGNLCYYGPLDTSHDMTQPSMLGQPSRDTLMGTEITMEIAVNSPVSIKAVFDEFADPNMEPGFYRTVIPVRILNFDNGDLMSRSQGKRLIARLEGFLDVVLDFNGIDFIGQGFADQVFRVFAASHPEIKLEAVNCCEEVRRMIAHVKQQSISH